MKKINIFLAVGLLFLLNACCKDKGPNQEPTIQIISPIDGAVYALHDTIRVEVIYKDDSKFKASNKIDLKSDSSSTIYYPIFSNVTSVNDTELHYEYYWINNLTGQKTIKLEFGIWDIESDIYVEEIIKIKTQ
ncbi:MAG: hypothetical protein LRY27_01420 [Chitinophagales bacterium]|nr:hypothetical protein [Chitinophagales bacterium]